MKYFIFIRHAKSSWANPLSNDHDRTLNERGLRDAPFMGKVLAKRGIRPDAVYSSSAVRALTTAQYFAEALRFDQDRITVLPQLYHADSVDILALIHTFDDSAETVLLFGHNPTLTDLANQLTHRFLDNLPTCGAVAVQFAVNHWAEAKPENGEFHFMEFPKMYFPKEILD